MNNVGIINVFMFCLNDCFFTHGLLNRGTSLLASTYQLYVREHYVLYNLNRGRKVSPMISIINQYNGNITTDVMSLDHVLTGACEVWCEVWCVFQMSWLFFVANYFLHLVSSRFTSSFHV